MSQKNPPPYCASPESKRHRTCKQCRLKGFCLKDPPFALIEARLENKRLERELAKVEKVNGSLTAELAESDSQNAALQANVFALTHQNADLVAENADLDMENSDLDEELTARKLQTTLVTGVALMILGFAVAFALALTGHVPHGWSDAGLALPSFVLVAVGLRVSLIGRWTPEMLDWAMAVCGVASLIVSICLR